MHIPKNTLCPCGSGKQYEHCCSTALNLLMTQSQPKDYEGAASKALAWLFDRHRKGMQVAREKLLSEVLTSEEIKALDELDADTYTGVDINLTEWLLAQGSILVKGSLYNIVDHVLSEGGPMLNLEQRAWITQLSQQPLRLYDVTDVVPGSQATLCDAVDLQAPPIVVFERSGTRNLEPGMRLGCRVMTVQDHFELSGCAYPFSRMMGHAVTEVYVAYLEEFGKDRQKAKQKELSLIILSQWLKQFVAPLPMPQMIDAYSGDLMLFITDHYLAHSWKTLTQRLENESDVEGNIADGWTRHLECTDGQIRPTVSIEPDTTSNQVAVFYKTQRYADQGRIWFDALAGDAVKFQTREIIDQASLASKQNLPNQGANAALKKVNNAQNQISPQELTKVIEATMHRMYANWADEPIPMLENQTPRQAMTTPAGLERVKGLIRSYEASEQLSAKEQQREPVSYDFLWEALGLTY